MNEYWDNHREILRKQMLSEYKLYAWTHFLSTVLYLFITMHCLMKDDKYWMLFLPLSIFYYVLCMVYKGRLNNER